MTLTPTQSEYVQWLRSMRGGPLSCLLALWIVRPHPVSRDHMIYMTNYKKDVVSEAMRVLVDVYFYASRITYRGEAWCLTDRGKQMCLPLFELFLGNVDARALSKSDLIAFPPVVVVDVQESIQEMESTTNKQIKSDKTAFDPDVQELLRQCGIFGRPLDTLSRRVSIETARAWKNWRTVAPKTVRNPAGVIVRALMADPTARPPTAAEHETVRAARRPTISGPLGERFALPQEEEIE